ncbi:DegT/DnrJ/EryC1/StrS family aminotransferase [Actinacidiphila yeochonensis]|uniref:DegT/DnrJ/EryC1/StrS family aminotransferase n=1 Tax=Actinacidiphila yeochonensis TaxID=89050 RepID=UPI000689E35F|nr:DegT/DnrJ/EryC1/StrS family aminotransferase [Actinacidiphila yeochonensis]
MTATALGATLTRIGIGPGDQVIVPSYGPSAPADGARLAGATPVFADIDPRTLCLSADAVAAAVTAGTAAVIPVNLFGYPAPVESLGRIARQHGLALIEEAPLEEDLGETARRRARARFLDSALTGVIVPYVEPGAYHRYHRYTVRIPGNGRPDRDAYARALAARGVRAEIAVPTPVHRLPAHRAIGIPGLPQTELAAADTLSLPIDSFTGERELTRLAAVCNQLGRLV